MARPRIVYVQYTNPAGYPPLEHSSHILAGIGWDVLFLGATADGARTLEFPPHPAIRVLCLPASGRGALQKLNYLVFLAWVLTRCLFYRPRWLYVSDPMACLPALLARGVSGCSVIYHEHDGPSYAAPISAFQRLFQATRARLARTADLVILPQRERLNALLAETGRQGPSFCVWNCPRPDEVEPPREVARDPAAPLRLYFHGSINPERLPASVLDALARASPSATLTVVGYETVGSQGYMQAFLAHAFALGLAARVSYLGPLERRSEILALARQADVGLAFMPIVSNDVNMRQMVGASNKPFDYLAVGTMLMVSDLAEWRELFVEPGYGIACKPNDIDSLANAIAWCATHTTEVRAMGEAGRQRVAADWNYTRQFHLVAGVLAIGHP